MKYHLACIVVIAWVCQANVSALAQVPDAEPVINAMKKLWDRNTPLSGRYHIVEPTEVVVNGKKQKSTKTEKLSILHSVSDNNLRRVIVKLSESISEDALLDIEADGLRHDSEICKRLRVELMQR